MVDRSGIYASKALALTGNEALNSPPLLLSSTRLYGRAGCCPHQPKLRRTRYAANSTLGAHPSAIGHRTRTSDPCEAISR